MTGQGFPFGIVDDEGGVPLPSVDALTGQAITTADGLVTRRVPADMRVCYRLSASSYRRAVTRGLFPDLDEKALSAAKQHLSKRKGATGRKGQTKPLNDDLSKNENDAEG